VKRSERFLPLKYKISTGKISNILCRIFCLPFWNPKI